MSWEERIEKRGLTWGVRGAVILSVIVLIILGWTIIAWTSSDHINIGAVDPVKSDAFGGFVGGLIGPLVGFVGTLLTLALLAYQIRELKHTVEAQKDSVKELKEQRKVFEEEKEELRQQTMLMKMQKELELVSTELDRALDRIHYLEYPNLKPGVQFTHEGTNALAFCIKNTIHHLDNQIRATFVDYRLEIVTASIELASIDITIALRYLESSVLINHHRNSLAHRFIREVGNESVSLLPRLKQLIKLESEKYPTDQILYYTDHSLSMTRLVEFCDVMHSLIEFERSTRT